MTNKKPIIYGIEFIITHTCTEAEINGYLSMNVPKRSRIVFCMFSVHSQLHWSFISRHKMFKATSAAAVSAAHMHIKTDMTHCSASVGGIRPTSERSKQTVEFCCSQVVVLGYYMHNVHGCKDPLYSA